MAFGRNKKTGTIDDVVEAAMQMGLSGDRAIQDEYLPAVDDALDSLPKKDRRKAGPTIAAMMFPLEAMRLDSITQEEGDLTVTKLRALAYQAFGGRKQPEEVLAGGSASQMAHTVRKVSDWYEEAYLEEQRKAKPRWFCPSCSNWNDDMSLTRCPECDALRHGFLAQ